MLGPVWKRFTSTPTLGELDGLANADFGGVLRLELAPYRLSMIQRVESDYPRSFEEDAPTVFADTPFFINRWPRFYWYERFDAPWHIRITDDLPVQDFGEQASSDPYYLSQYLDRLIPDRRIRYAEGEWYGFQIGKNRWAAGFVEDIQPPAQVILRVPYIIFDREISPEDIDLLRGCQPSKPLVVWDDGVQSETWKRLGRDPPLGENQPGWHGGPRLRFIDPELPLQASFDLLGTLRRTAFVQPEFKAGDFSNFHSSEVLAMNLRGSVLLPSRPFRASLELKTVTRKPTPRRKKFPRRRLVPCATRAWGYVPWPNRPVFRYDVLGLLLRRAPGGRACRGRA